MRISGVALACLLAACGGTGDDGGHFSGIEIEPAVVTLTVPLVGTATQGYKVFGVTASGRTEISFLVRALCIAASSRATPSGV